MEDTIEELKVCIGALRPYGPGIAEEVEKTVDAILAERDRLAAENAELKQRLTRSIIAAELAAANATLDALTNAFPNLDAMHEILYPKETNDDNG